LGSRGKMQRRAFWKTEISVVGSWKLVAPEGWECLIKEPCPDNGWHYGSDVATEWRWLLIAKVYFSTGCGVSESLNCPSEPNTPTFSAPFGLYLEKLQILQWVAWTLNAPKFVSLSTGI
jgi:hypothetical protein